MKDRVQSMRGLSVIVALVIAIFLITSGCSHKPAMMSSKTPNLQESARILADYQPWFGSPDHIKIGYSTLDAAVLRKQIQEAQVMGIYAFGVDGYGDRRPFEDRSYALLQQVTAESNFHICLMYDETEEDNGQATDNALNEFDKAYRDYIGPNAPGHEAYVTYQGRPLIFIYPKRGHTDGHRRRAAYTQWEHPPILIYKDQPPLQYEKDFDGYYPWVHP